MAAMLQAASTSKNPVLHGGDIQKIFADFLAQVKGGISRERQAGARYGSAMGSVGTGNGIIFSYPTKQAFRQDVHDAFTIINELPHIAGSKGGWPQRAEYDDYYLAQAIHKTSYDKRSTFQGKRFADAPGFTKRFPNSDPGFINPFEAYPTPGEQWANRYNNRWSTYVHDILNQNCRLQ